MKTGKVAKVFGIDHKTVSAWTQEFSEFFTEDALGEGRTQREYHPDDLVILNTIRALKAQRTLGEEILARLRAGERNADLPPDATNIEGDRAVVVYSQLKTLQAQLENTIGELDRTRQELTQEREGRRQDNEKNITEIRRLEREIGGIEMQLKMLKEQSDKR